VADEDSDLFGKIDALVNRRDPGGWRRDGDSSATAEGDFPLLTDVYAPHGDDQPAPESGAETAAPPPEDIVDVEDIAQSEGIETLYRTLEKRLVSLAERELAPRLQREVDSAMAEALAQIHTHIGVALRQAIEDELAVQLSRRAGEAPADTV
jgi:hypothetical protein